VGLKAYGRHPDWPPEPTEPLLRRLAIPLLALTAALEFGCAQLPQLPADFAAALETPPLELEARGPGALFDSVEAAAVDALKFSYLQAREAGDMQRMRAGTIRRSGAGYTYGEIHVAKPWKQRRVEYRVDGLAVARFQLYPPHSDYDVNRASERLSTPDWRSMSVIDPLHRSLYVLHPPLAIRAYQAGRQAVEVTNLGGPARAWEWPSAFAMR
jgi:hypothetical protein